MSTSASWRRNSDGVKKNFSSSSTESMHSLEWRRTPTEESDSGSNHRDFQMRRRKRITDIVPIKMHLYIHAEQKCTYFVHECTYTLHRNLYAKSVHNYVAQKCAADAQTCADALTFACGSRTGCGLSVCSWFATFVFILTVSFVKYWMKNVVDVEQGSSLIKTNGGVLCFQPFVDNFFADLETIKFLFEIWSLIGLFVLWIHVENIKSTRTLKCL